MGIGICHVNSALSLRCVGVILLCDYIICRWLMQRLFERLQRSIFMTDVLQLLLLVSCFFCYILKQFRYDKLCLLFGLVAS